MDENAKHQQSNIEVARLYGLLTSGDATCSLKDLEALTAKEVRSVPVTYWELESNLGMFGNLIHVVLGSTHPLVTAYREFWTLMRSGL
jgi:cytochrome bd-type quinol oxidase subunit 1